MRQKITSLLILLVMVGFNVSAQYTTDGVYTIQNKHVDRNNYLASNGTTDAIAVTDYTTDPNAKLRIVANGLKYNILSNDGAYVLSNKAFVLSSSTNLNLANSLVEFVVIGDYYLIRYNNDATNLNLKSATDVGAGDYTMDNYQWTITPYVPAATVSVTQPTEGEVLVPGTTVVFKATAAAEEGETLTKVEFYVDGNIVGEDADNTDGSYEYTWTTNAASGSYAVTAKATSTGSSTTTEAVNFSVANLPASITLDAPGRCATGAEIQLVADPSPSTGATVSKVEFYNGVTLIGTRTSADADYVLAWTPTVAETASITAKITDSADDTETSAVSSVVVVEALVNPVKCVFIDFEDAIDTDWTSETIAKATVSISADKGIGGSKALAVDIVAGQTAHLYSNVSKVDQTAGEYVHLIASSAASNAAVGMSALSFRTDAWAGPTPGPYAFTGVANDTYRRETVSKTVGAYNEYQYSPRVRVRTVEASTVYFDNMVIYAHASTSPDLIAPVKATEFTYAPVGPLSMAFDWTEGSDASTGINMTYILRTANVAAVSPVLMAQSAYAVNGVVGGDWTIIGTVAAGVTTFTDNDAIAGPSVYAVVHKDLAYNYSEALLSTDVATGIEKVEVNAFNCYGTKGAIELSALPQGEQLTVFSISGAKVSAQSIVSSELTIDLSAGIYLVRVAGDVQKVVVK